MTLTFLSVLQSNVRFSITYLLNLLPGIFQGGGFVTGMAQDLLMRQIYGNVIRVALLRILVKACVIYYDGSQVKDYAVYRLIATFNTLL